MKEPIDRWQLECPYCTVAGVCPACQGEGQLVVEQNTPPYTYLETCEECNGTGLCPMCWPSEGKGTPVDSSPPHKG